MQTIEKIQDCEFCEGTGMVPVMAPVYGMSEVYSAYVESQYCRCTSPFCNND